MLKVDKSEANNMKQTNISTLKDFLLCLLMWASFTMIYLLITNL